MKKNIFTVIIFAIALVNMVLTAVLIFTVVPSTNKTNKLINQISSVIDLELEGEIKSEGEQVVSASDRTPYRIETENTKVNLTIGNDGSPHWGVFEYITLSLNSKAKDYKKLSENLEKNQDLIVGKVTRIIGSYTHEQALGKQEQMEEAVLNELQEYFETTSIVGVVIGSLVFH